MREINRHTKVQKLSARFPRSAQGNEPHVRLRRVLIREIRSFMGLPICWLALADVCDITSRRATDLERKITTLQNPFQPLEAILSQLSPLFNILEAENNRSPQKLCITCRYLDFAAMMLRKGAVADKKDYSAQCSMPPTARNI